MISGIHRANITKQMHVLWAAKACFLHDVEPAPKGKAKAKANVAVFMTSVASTLASTGESFLIGGNEVKRLVIATGTLVAVTTQLYLLSYPLQISRTSIT